MKKLLYLVVAFFVGVISVQVYSDIFRSRCDPAETSVSRQIVVDSSNPTFTIVTKSRSSKFTFGGSSTGKLKLGDYDKSMVEFLGKNACRVLAQSMTKPVKCVEWKFKAKTKGIDGAKKTAVNFSEDGEGERSYNVLILAEDKVDVTDPSKDIVVDDSKFSIVVQSNPSTGYSWSLKNYDSNVIKYKSRKSHSLSSGGMIGAPELEEWMFEVDSEAAASRKTTITMVYSRPWEKNKQEETNYTVVIKN